MLTLVGPKGPSLPIGINRARYERNVHAGKADPVWDVQFTTKFSPKPKEDAPLLQPKGSLNPMERFVNRVAEIEWLANTQHLELATTKSLLAANGVTLDDEVAAANRADLHANRTPFSPDPAEKANMQRRIDWEKWLFACGPCYKTRLTLADGKVAVEYDGPRLTPAEVMERKRAHVSRLRETVGIPDADTLANELARREFYGGMMVLSSLTPDEASSWRSGFSSYDDEPDRSAWLSEDMRGRDDRGYAGPSGMLGIDDNGPSEDWEDEEDDA